MTQPETEENQPYANAYLPDKEEFRQAIITSDTFAEMIDHAIAVLYSNLRDQAVINRFNGQLLTASIGIRDPKEGIKAFHFALLTENGHVAKP